MKALIARLRRRYWIFKELLERGNEIEQGFPQAHLIGIGFNTIYWAAIEHQLDILIHWHAVTRLGDNRKDHPRSLVNKLDYLKKIEKDQALESDNRALLREIRLSLANMSEARHDFTHSFSPIGDPRASWSAIRFRYEGKNLKAVQKRFQIEDIQSLTQDITREIGRLSPLVQTLCQDWMIANRSRFMSSSTEKPCP